MSLETSQKVTASQPDAPIQVISASREIDKHWPTSEGNAPITGVPGPYFGSRTYSVMNRRESV